MDRVKGGQIFTDLAGAMARREDIEMLATSWRLVTIYRGRSKKSHLEAQLVEVHDDKRVTYWVRP